MPLLQIATDGGLIAAPVSSSTIPLSMAERIEVVIDFSVYPVGSSIILQNLNSQEISGAYADQIMLFDVVRRASDDSRVPPQLCTFERVTRLPQHARVSSSFPESPHWALGRLPPGTSTESTSILITRLCLPVMAMSRSGISGTRSFSDCSGLSTRSTSTWFTFRS